MPDMDKQMERGDFATFLSRSRKHHRHGRRFFRNDLMQRATGKTLGTADYIRYLKEKYSALYKL